MCDTTQPPTTAAVVATGKKRKRAAGLTEDGPYAYDDGGEEIDTLIQPSKSSDMLDKFDIVEDELVDSAISTNPSSPRGGRFLPMIRYLEKSTVTTSSVITSSANATNTATYPLFFCTPSGLTSTSACASSIAYINLVRE